jgi:nitrogen-specific signal transduction histidine kinase
MGNGKVEDAELNESKKSALHYMKVLIDVASESFLILDPDIRVVLANPTFYQNFLVTPAQTENKFLYELGNGQWDIPELKKLLEEILPQEKVVKNYEVEHVFPTIGKKTIQLNARKLDESQLIILAMEDITARKELEKKLSEYTAGLEVKVAERTAELATQVKELESVNKTMVDRELKMVELKKEIEELKKK